MSQKGIIVKIVFIITYVIYLFHFADICNDGTKANGGYNGWQRRRTLNSSLSHTCSKNMPVPFRNGLDKAVKITNFTKCDPMCFLNILCNKIGSRHKALLLPIQSSMVASRINLYVII